MIGVAWYLFWPGVVAILMATGLCIRGLVALGRFLRAVIRIADALPTLLTIGEQFKPNSGRSLHDTISSIDRRLGRLESGQTSIRVEQGKVATDLATHGSSQ